MSHFQTGTDIETEVLTHSQERDEDEQNKPCVGQFGSFVGYFNDGLNISLSTYGRQGVPENGKVNPFLEPTVFFSIGAIDAFLFDFGGSF